MESPTARESQMTGWTETCGGSGRRSLLPLALLQVSCRCLARKECSGPTHLPQVWGSTVGVMAGQEETCPGTAGTTPTDGWQYRPFRFPNANRLYPTICFRFHVLTRVSYRQTLRVFIGQHRIGRQQDAPQTHQCASRPSYEPVYCYWHCCETAHSSVCSSRQSHVVDGCFKARFSQPPIASASPTANPFSLMAAIGSLPVALPSEDVLLKLARRVRMISRAVLLSPSVLSASAGLAAGRANEPKG